MPGWKNPPKEIEKDKLVDGHTFLCGEETS